MAGASATSPRFFRSADDFGRWLATNHDRVREMWVGFYNQRSGRTGITYKQAVDEALCMGWIDGVRKSLDANRYTQRFTPRSAKSIWSLVNARRVGELKALGRMKPPGLAAFERRDPARTGVYSFEREKAELGPSLERTFRANEKAWAFFQSRPPGYRRICTWYVVSAKKEETRLRRLATLIEVCAKGAPLPGLDRRPAGAGKKTP